MAGDKRGPKTKHVADKIDPEECQKLAAMGCTMQEIADFVGCSVDTLERNFAEAINIGRSRGRMSVKRKLYEKAMTGDLGAIIWWGKNFAGMADKVETKHSGQIDQKQITETPQEQLQRIKNMMKDE